MRDEMLGAVVRRAIEHPEFRERLMNDMRGALDDHGFALTPEDFSELENIRRDLASPGSDVEQQLVSVAEKFGIRAATK